MGFGQILREARETKGYTVEQLADITHIMPSTIRGLEDEAFTGIAAPIYGRGFVKLCCQALSLDPKPMVDEFMAIYNGEKPASAPVAATPAPVSEPEQEPTPEQEPESATEPEPVPSPAPVTEPEPVAEPAAEEPPTVPEPPPSNPFRPIEPIAPATETVRSPYGDLFNQPQEEPEPTPHKASVGRFAPPRPQDEPDDRKLISLPELPWRLIALAVGAIMTIWVLFAGCRAIYRALSTPDANPTVVEQPQNVEQPKADVRPAASGADTASAAKPPRTPKPVKPLYID